MNSQMLSSLAALFGLCLVCAYAAPSSGVSNKVHENQDLLFITKILEPVKKLAQDALHLQTVIEKAAKHQSIDVLLKELPKRQAAWDRDYDWGGGRFGKRSGNNMDVLNQKRYDMYDFAGRFGRDTDHVESLVGENK